MEKSISDKIVKLYSWIISFIAIVVIAINLGVAVSGIFKSVIITDAEYIADRYSYRINNCSLDIAKNGKQSETVEECELRIRENALLERKVNLKNELIDSISFLITFSVLFWFHYPKFRNKQK